MPDFRTSSCWAFVASFGVALAPACICAGQPEAPPAAEFIAKAPVIDSRDGKHKRIYVEGRVSEEGLGDLELRAFYKAPNSYSLSILDGIDDTPIVYVVNGEGLVYNAADGCVMYFVNAAVEYSLCLKGAGLVPFRRRGR